MKDGQTYRTLAKKVEQRLPVLAINSTLSIYCWIGSNDGSSWTVGTVQWVLDKDVFNIETVRAVLIEWFPCSASTDAEFAST